MTSRRGFIKGIEARLDLPTFESILALMDRFIVRRVVPDVGALVTWQVEWAGHISQPLGYVMALPVGDRILIGFYRLDGEIPPKVGNSTDDEEAPRESGGTDPMLWLMVHEVVSALKRHGIRWQDNTPFSVRVGGGLAGM